MGGLKYGMEYRPYYLAKEWVKWDIRLLWLGHRFLI